MMQRHSIPRLCRFGLAGAASLTLLACDATPIRPPAPPAAPAAPVAVSVPPIDTYYDKARVAILTDIANEPDDQMSMVRLLVYANQFDIEALVATTSTWMRAKIRPDVINQVIDAYIKVHPVLSTHAEGYPDPGELRAKVTSGQPAYGMAAVGPDHLSPGASLLIRIVDRPDPRPLWVLAWGGTNTLAQTLTEVRRTRTPDEVLAFVKKLRVYTISDQDDAGPWIRREFPTLFYVAMPSTPDGDEYYRATWTGISGDRFYKNGDGADFSMFERSWVDAHIRSRGPMGALYIPPCCIHEGDTPSFLGLINNGLASAMSPTFGGWGGRYVWRQPYGESRPFWTQGGDSYPGRDNSKDTVIGIDGRPHTSDQATIWRWRSAFQRDFAARMLWTTAPTAQANHNPVVVVNGMSGRMPIEIKVGVGTPVVLDAAGTSDPDGHRLTYRWFFYPEAGTGVPNDPVSTGPAVPIGGGGNRDDGGIPSAAGDGPPEPPARLVLDRADGPRVSATLRVPGHAHVVLEVTDNGTPALTSYRRVILRN